eukprot:scaffold217111_cov110-Attheya_sp.AAC.3
MGSVNIDTGTYHPASASKKSSSSSSSSSTLVSSNGRLVLALDEVGLSSPRSFASTSFAHMALLRVILPSLENYLSNKTPQLNQERQEEDFRCLSNVECLYILSTNSFVHSSFLFFRSNGWSPSIVLLFLSRRGCCVMLRLNNDKSACQIHFYCLNPELNK